MYYFAFVVKWKSYYFDINDIKIRSLIMGLYTVFSNKEICRINEEIGNEVLEYHLDIEACEWFFPEFQKAIFNNKKLIDKKLYFYIKINTKSEISLLQYLAVYMVFKKTNIKSNQYDEIIFEISEEIEDADLAKIYGKVSRFLILFFEGNQLYRNFRFSKIPQFAINANIVNCQLWPYERGGFGETGIPLLPIDSYVYAFLQENIQAFLNQCEVHSKNGMWKEIARKWKSPKTNNSYAKLKEVAIREICRDFWNRLVILKNGGTYSNEIIDDEVLNILKNTNVLTFLLFGAAFFGIYNPGESSKTLRKRKALLTKDHFIVLFEKCASYSMGILQLIENTINYTIGGFLSFRAIKRDNQYLDSILQSKEEDFLAISLCDLAKNNNGYKNMTEVFISNLKERRSENGTEELLKEIEENDGIKRLSINDLIFPDTSSDIKISKYLSDPHNVGYHYGLQIFSSSVEGSNGDFFAVSGNNCSCDYAQLSTITENMNIKNFYKKREKSVYYFGTKFEILLPISGIVETDNHKNENKLIIPTELSFDAKPDIVPDRINVNFNSVLNTIREGIDESRSFFNRSALSTQNKKKWVANIQNIIKNETSQQNSIKNKTLIPLQINFSNNFDFNIESNILLEVIAKAIFLLLSDERFKYKNIVLYGFDSDVSIINFVRYYAQFYNRSGYNVGYAKNSQVMLVSNENGTSKCVTLSGKYIGKPLYDYTDFTGGERFNAKDKLIENTLNRIGIRTKSNFKISRKEEEAGEKNNPHCFDNVIIHYNEKLTLKWIADLHNAASADFSNQNKFGAKIHDCVTHMHVSGVHIDSFYQIDTIFTNAYWAKMLGNWLAENVRSEKPIIFVGYNSLIEPVLFNAQQILGEDCDYLIYNEGYHYTAENIAQAKLIDNSQSNRINKLIKNKADIIYIMPISTTLNTFRKMAKCFNEQFDSNNKAKFIAIFQLFDKNESDEVSELYFSEYSDPVEIDSEYSNGYFSVIDKNFIKANKSFIAGQESTLCQYFFKLDAKWQNAQECSYCYPKKSNFERMLYSTDDTSLVPTMQLRAFNQKNSRNKENYNSLNFFEQKQSQGKAEYIYADCLLYKHVERDVHFSHYIKTEKLFKKILTNGKFEEKIIQIKEKLTNNIKMINIIIAPSHISNQTLPIKINEYIYNNDAHIISVNVKKVYRSNFESQFSNYSALIRELYRRIPEDKKDSFDISQYIGIIYVDDHINTSVTFNRMKSLLNDLLAIYDDNGNRIGGYIGFDAIITLIDRHSAASIGDYIGNTNNFFSFFKLHVPAIRTGGDSCYLCKQVADDKKLELAAALDSTASFCSNELKIHEAQEISNVKEEPDKNILNRHMRRFEAENILWQTILDAEREYYMPDLYEYEFLSNMYTAIFNSIKCKIDSIDNTEEKIEYLISFLKVLSRPFLSYRPFVATVSLAFYKSIIEMLLKIPQLSKKNKEEIYQFEVKITNKGFNKNKILDIKRKAIYFSIENTEKMINQLTSLLIVAISGLANLNSTYLLDIDIIKKIILLYKRLHFKNNNIFLPVCIIDDTKQTNRSFSDYLRFAIFKIVHNDKFGKDRLLNFEKKLVTELENLDEGKNRKIIDYYKLLILLYLENADTSNEHITEKAIENMRIKIIEDKKKGNETVLDTDNDDKNDYRAKANHVFDNSIIYIDEREVNKNATDRSDIILTPITSEGYADSFNIGFDLHFLGKEYDAIDSAINPVTKQLWGKLKLKEKCSKDLNTFGIYFNDDLKFDGNDFIFIKFHNEEEIFMPEDESGEKKMLPQMPSLYLRIKFDAKDFMNNLKALRSILCSRSDILCKLAKDLSTEDIRCLVAERRFNRALSITKAYKHATEDAERLTIYNEDVKKSNMLIGQIRRLLSNRTASSLYQTESIYFESENRNENNNDIAVIRFSKFWDERDNFDKYTQIWNLIQKNLVITGKKDANSSHDVELTFKIENFDSNKRERYLKYKAFKEEKLLLDFVFLLANNAIRHLPEKYETDINRKSKIVFSISQNGEYVRLSSPIGQESIDDNCFKKIARAIAIPPHVRKYYKENYEKNESDGITLWSIARYYQRLNKSEKSIEFLFDVNNYIAGYDYFYIQIEKKDNINYFVANLKCINEE